jgi:hypothetical protein
MTALEHSTRSGETWTAFWGYKKQARSGNATKVENKKYIKSWK